MFLDRLGDEFIQQFDKFILGSKSPQRFEIFNQMGVINALTQHRFFIIPSQFKEDLDKTKFVKPQVVNKRLNHVLWVGISISLDRRWIDIRMPAPHQLDLLLHDRDFDLSIVDNAFAIDIKNPRTGKFHQDPFTPKSAKCIRVGMLIDALLE